METAAQPKTRSRIPKGLPAQVAETLRERIRSGVYETGERLPSERVLEEDLNVDRRSVRSAIERLEAEGLLERRPNCRPIVNASAIQPESIPVPPGLAASRLIALVMWHGGAVDFAGTAQQRVFWGMNEVLGESGYHGVFLDVGQSISGTYQLNAEREAEHLSYALNHGFGGVVFYPQAYNSNRELIQEMSRHMPLVLLDRLIPGVRTDFVGSENRQATAEATWHLINKGHSRIGFITSGEFINTVQERLTGYLDALREAFPVEPYELILTPPLVNSKSWPMLDAICSLPERERPTAIICVNNIEAVRVANHLAKHNLSVPEDVSLIGFDNIERTLPNGVSLTTIAQPFEEIGKAAAKLIIQRSQDRSIALSHLELPTRLIPHNSVRSLEDHVQTPSNRDLLSV